MHFGIIIGLTLVFSGVLSAPSNSLDSPPLTKNNDQDSPAITPQVSVDSSFTKKYKTVVSSETRPSSVKKDDESYNLSQLSGDNSPVVKNANIKSEVKDGVRVSSSSETEDKNQVGEESKATQDLKVKSSPDIAVRLEDVLIENEVVAKIEKEVSVKANAGTPISKDGKLSAPHELPPQKPAVSQLIGNFLYEMMQAPIYLLRACKDLVGGMLGIRQPGVTTAVTASAPY